MSGWDQMPVDGAPAAPAVPVQKSGSGWDSLPVDSTTPSSATPAWAANNRPFKLSNGAQTVLRQDGFVWLDPSKGDSTKNGWYRWTGRDWEQGPNEPAPKGHLRRAAEAFAYTPVMQGLTDPVVKTAQLATRLPFVPKGAQDWVDNAVRDREEAYNSLPLNRGVAAMLTRSATQAVPMLLLGPAGEATTFIGKTAAGAGEGALGAMLQPTILQDGQQDQFVPETLKQGLIGAVVGGAVPGAQKVLGFAKKGVQKVLGDKMVLNPKYFGAPELSDQLSQAGIEHTVGDITSDPAIVRMEASMARNDPRMMDLRVRQNQQGLEHAESVAKDLYQEMAKQGFDGLDQVTAAAKGAGPRAAAANRLLSAVEASGDDWKTIVQTSGKLTLFKNKLRADKLADELTDMSAQHGEVPMMNTARALKEAKADLAASALPDEATARIVSTLDKNLNREAAGQGQLAQAVGGGPATASVLPPQSAVDTSYAGLRNLRGSLGNKISDYYTGKNSMVGKEGVGLLQKIKNAVEADMDEFAKSNGPEMASKWREFNSFYRNNVVPFKDKAFAQALSDESPQKLGQFFQSKDPYVQNQIFSLLDAKGQAAVRSGIIGDAIDAGEKTQRGVMAPTFSAARAASALEKLESNGTMGVAFKGESGWAARGLARILRTIDSSDSVAFVPKTGEVAEGLGKLAKGDLTAMGAAERAYQWLNRERLYKLYTDPKGKALLIHASMLKPGSPAMQKLIDRLPAALGMATGQPGQQPPTTTPEP